MIAHLVDAIRESTALAPLGANAQAITRLSGSFGRVTSAAATTSVASPNSKPSTESLTWSALAVITLIGLGLRLARFDESFSIDELFARQEILPSQSLSDLIKAVSESIEVSPPLFFVLAWICSKFSSSIDAIRLPSLIAGTAAIPIAFLVGRRAVGSLAGTVAAAVVAFDPLAIFYSAEARPYALATLLGGLTLLLILRAVEGRRLLDWAWFTLAASASLYTHYTAVFLVGGALLWVLIAFRQQLWRQALLSGLAIALIFLPWLPQVGGKRVLVIYGAISAGEVPLATLKLPASAMLGSNWVPLDHLPGLTVVSLVLGAIAVGAIGHLIRSLSTGIRPRFASPAVGVLLASASVPGGLGCYSALSGTNLLNARNLSSVIVGIAVLAAAMMVTRPEWLAALTISIALSAMLFAAVDSVQSRNQNTNLKQASKLVTELLPSNAIIWDGSFTRMTPSLGRIIPRGTGTSLYLGSRFTTFDGTELFPAWYKAITEKRPLAIVTVDPGKSKLAGLLKARGSVAKQFTLACERWVAGIAPLLIRVYVPLGSNPEVAKSCLSAAAD